MELSVPLTLVALGRDLAREFGASVAVPKNSGCVRITYADGSVLDLTINHRRTRITVSAVLPERAAEHGIEVKPITVTAQPLPDPGESPSSAAVRHLAAHIRRRLRPAHSAALASLRRIPPERAVFQRAEVALSSFPERPRGGWLTFDKLVRRPLGEEQRYAVAWWQSIPGDASRATAPFVADALRRAGLATTEPQGSNLVYFAEPPAESTGPRYRIVPSRDIYELVDEITGACLRSYDDREWAEGIADSENQSAAAARRAGVASLELPGLSTELVDVKRVRKLAVDLATAGHMPYGLTDVDFTKTPGFFIYPGPKPSVVRVARLLEPWGAIRPGARLEAPDREVERYDEDLEAYARLLDGPGRTLTVGMDSIHVEFDEGTCG